MGREIREGFREKRMLGKELQAEEAACRGMAPGGGFGELLLMLLLRWWRWQRRLGMVIRKQL